MGRDDVRAVFFDAGYTLLCMDPPQETLFLRICSEMAISVDSSRLPHAVKNANAMLAPQAPAHAPAPYSPERVDRFWIEYHRTILAGCALREAAADSAESFYRRFTAALGWRIYDDVTPLLDELHARGIALGIISNWTGDLEDVLQRIGLHARFDVILDSARFGHEKPHPQIFAEALRRAGVSPASAMHVGDSVEHDVDGALAAGLRPVLIDRLGRYRAYDRAPRVSDLKEILDLI